MEIDTINGLMIEIILLEILLFWFVLINALNKLCNYFNKSWVGILNPREGIELNRILTLTILVICALIYSLTYY